MEYKDELLLLKNLITDEDFDKLQIFSSNLNFYRITGMKSQEIKHSNTIAWFLNPFESHNLGLLFFRKFITQLFEENSDYFNSQGINIVELLLRDFNDAEVVRERENNIDLLFKTKENKFLLCIENKIKSGLSDKQLDKYYEYISEKYPDYKKIFLLLSQSGYDVPVDKSKYVESWISASYENIVKIFRSILNSNIDLKMQYIIRDYIELLEKEHIVENTELNTILAKLCTKHKEAIELLLEYRNNIEQSQPVLKLIKEVFVETLKELKNEKKIIDYQVILSGFFLVFYTQNMNEHFPPLNDNSGSWKDSYGSKYRYWIDLKKPELHIVFELGPLGQSDDTIAKFNEILKFVGGKKEITSTDKTRKMKKWSLDIDWSDLSLDDMSDESIRKCILETYEKIVSWESELRRKLES